MSILVLHACTGVKWGEGVEPPPPPPVFPPHLQASGQMLIIIIIIINRHYDYSHVSSKCNCIHSIVNKGVITLMKVEDMSDSELEATDKSIKIADKSIEVADKYIEVTKKSWCPSKVCLFALLLIIIALIIISLAIIIIALGVWCITEQNETIKNLQRNYSSLEGNFSVLSDRTDKLERQLAQIHNNFSEHECMRDSDCANKTGLGIPVDNIQQVQDDIQGVNISLQDLITSTNTSIQLLRVQQMELEIESYRNISEVANSSQEVSDLLHELINFTNTEIEGLKAEQMKLAMESYENISHLENYVAGIEGGLTSLVQDTHVNLTEALGNANTRLTFLNEIMTQLARDSYNNISAIVELFEGRIAELDTRISDHISDTLTLEELNSQAHQDFRRKIDILDERLNEVMKHNGAMPFKSVHWSIVLVACALVMYK